MYSFWAAGRFSGARRAAAPQAEAGLHHSFFKDWGLTKEHAKPAQPPFCDTHARCFNTVAGILVEGVQEQITGHRSD